MNLPLSESMAECPDCGAMQSRVLVPCWLCGKPLGPEHLIVDAELVEPPNPAAETIFGMITAMAIVAALMVGVGLIVDNPLMATAYFLVVIPALGITLYRVNIRTKSGDFSWGDTLLTMVLSTVGVAAALIFLAMAFALAMIAMFVARW